MIFESHIFNISVDLIMNSRTSNASCASDGTLVVVVGIISIIQ